MTNLPFTGKIKVTCEYLRKGNLWSSGYHKGIDLVCGNKDVYCTCDGVVKTVGWDPDGWGRYIRVEESTTKRIHIFCHLVKDSAKVKVGQKVFRATVLGVMGSTGNSTGAHLHFQIEKSNIDRTVYDPTDWLGIPNKVGTYDSEDYQIKEVEKVAYKDQKSIPAWAKDAVDYVTKEKLMIGDDLGNFNPNKPITRAEMAVILQRLGK